MSINHTPSTSRLKRTFTAIIFLVIIMLFTTACGPSTAELSAVDYTPSESDDWQVSTPAEQGLDPEQVARLYLAGQDVETLNALLVIKNGYLVAEGYFHGGSQEQATRIHTAS